MEGEEALEKKEKKKKRAACGVGVRVHLTLDGRKGFHVGLLGVELSQRHGTSSALMCGESFGAPYAQQKETERRGRD